MKCEIEFLPVGNGAKPGDAIVVRYGEPNNFELMIVDGGTLESGQALVDHITTHFPGRGISHVLLTHPDLDHASGLRVVLDQLPIANFWLHVPWLHAEACLPYFLNKSWSAQGLANALRKEYDLLSDLVDKALSRAIALREPFSGATIGPFTVVSPYAKVYELLLPQFDRTPAPDQAAIETQGFWLAKQGPPSGLGAIFEKALAKVQKWIPESWEAERLREGGITSATNESSVVLHGAFEAGRVLLTADAGRWALTFAARFAEQHGLGTAPFSFVQVPHHGSRRNVGPTILNQLVGPILARDSAPTFSAYVSAPPDDDTHPRKIVVNAFRRRGGAVIATQGSKKIYYGGFPPRPGYVPVQPLPFSNQVEDYDE